MSACPTCRDEGFVCCGCPDEGCDSDGRYVPYCCGYMKACPDCNTAPPTNPLLPKRTEK